MKNLVSSHAVLGVLAVVALILYGTMIIVGKSVPSGFESVTYGLISAFATGTGYAIAQKTAAAKSSGSSTSTITGS